MEKDPNRRNMKRVNSYEPVSISPEKIYKKSRFFNLEKGEKAENTKTEILNLSSLQGLNNNNFPRTTRTRKTEVIKIPNPMLEDLFVDKKNQTLKLKKKKKYKFGDKPHKKWANIEDIIQENSSSLELKRPEGEFETEKIEDFSEDAIQLEMKLGSNNIKAAKGFKQIPLLINLKEKKFDEENIIIDSKMDLVCAIDVSSSMSGPRMRYVHETLLSLLDVLDKGHRVAFVIFDHEANFLMNFKKINEKNKPKIRDIILSIRKRGKTNIKAGLNLAQKVLGKRFSLNPTSCIFLLSDGDHNCGDFCIDDIFSEDRLRTKSDYVLSTFGYGNDHDAYLLEKLAMRKKGNYYYINNLKQIQECFLDSLGLYTSVLAKEVQIGLRLFENDIFSEIKFCKNYGSNWIQFSDDELGIMLPSYYSGFNRNFLTLIRFKTKNIEEVTTVKLAEIQLSMKNLDKQNPKKFVIPKEITLTIYPQSSHEHEDPDFNMFEFDSPILADQREVMIQLVRVKSAEIMSEVDRAFSNKNFAKAILILEEFLLQIHQIDEIQDSPLVQQVKDTLVEQKEFIIKDEKGENHAFKTSMFIVQMMHVFDSETSSSMKSSDLFCNKKQIKMRSMMLYVDKD